MKVSIVDKKGKSVKDITLDKSVFGVSPKVEILSQYVYSYLSNQREANAQVKDRSEVRGGGKKPWRQKGTGRARFGSSRNPIWKGGGVAFGPSNLRNFKKKVTKKFRLAAFRNALSSIADTIIVVDSFSFDEKNPLTSQGLDLVKNLKIEGKYTVVTNSVDTLVVKAFSNISKANVIFVGELNPYDIINAGTLVIEEAALHTLTERLKVEKS